MPTYPMNPLEFFDTITCSWKHGPVDPLSIPDKPSVLESVVKFYRKLFVQCHAGCEESIQSIGIFIH